MNVQTTQPQTDERTTRSGRGARRPLSILSLSLVLALLAVGALQGGIAMVTNPIDPLGMSPTFLDGTPVADYFWPGLFLIGIALASLVTTAGLLFNWTWKWARPIEASIGFRWPWLGAVSTGTILLVFEIIELFMVPFHPVMHPLLIAGSLAIVALPNLPSARAFLSAGPPR